jgi:hypothetical protein
VLWVVVLQWGKYGNKFMESVNISKLLCVYKMLSDFVRLMSNQTAMKPQRSAAYIEHVALFEPQNNTLPLQNPTIHSYV